MRSLRPALLLLLLTGAGCIIPIRRRTLLRPAGTVVVIDAQSGEPLANARVVVRRFNLGPPPRRESRRDVAMTGADGRATFTLLTGHEWVMPLMMHGVPEWVFDVCADAPGHHGAPRSWLIQGMWTVDADLATQPTLTIALVPGDGACEHSADWRDFMTQVDSRPPEPAR